MQAFIWPYLAGLLVAALIIMLVMNALYASSKRSREFVRPGKAGDGTRASGGKLDHFPELPGRGDGAENPNPSDRTGTV